MQDNARQTRCSRNHSRLAVLSLCAPWLPALLFAQQPDPPRSTLSGSVVHSQSGEPLQGSEVVLSRINPPPVVVYGGGPRPPPTMWETTTDARGKYQFVALEPGRYSLYAQKRGYSSPESTISSARVLLSAGKSASGVNFELTPQTSFSGRIIDEQGNPVPFVGITILQEQYIDGRKQLFPIRGGGSQTNERGEFKLTGVWQGPMVLEFGPQRLWNPTPAGITEAAPNLAYFTTYYPGTSDISKAVRIEASPGAERSGLEARILKARVSRLRGVVLDHTGERAGNCSIILKPTTSLWGSVFAAHVTKAPDGAFEFQHVHPGPHRLIVQRDAIARVHRQEIVVGSNDMDDLVVRLPQPVQIEGELFFEPGAKVDPKTVFVTLHTDEEGIANSPTARMITGAGGKFVIEDIFPGKYRLGTSWLNDMSPLESAYVARIQYGAVDATDAPVEITARPDAIRVTFDSGTGLLTGMVTKNGAPARRARVLLFSADKARRLNQAWTKTGWTYEDGRFSIERIKPGNYLALALEESEEGFWRDEERFKRFEPAAKKVSIPRSGLATVNLAVMPLPRD